MKNPFNVLKAYLKRSRIATLMFSQKNNRKAWRREWKRKILESVSIFPPIISLSCLVCCKYLIYTFSDIKSLLFVFSVNSATRPEEEENFHKTFLRQKTEELIERKLKFKDFCDGKRNLNISRSNDSSSSYLFAQLSRQVSDGISRKCSKIISPVETTSDVQSFQLQILKNRKMKLLMNTNRGSVQHAPGVGVQQQKLLTMIASFVVGKNLQYLNNFIALLFQSSFKVPSKISWKFYLLFRSHSCRSFAFVNTNYSIKKLFFMLIVW